MTNDINPVCAANFADQDKDQAATTARLAGHDELLEQHGRQLAEHSAILKQHQDLLHQLTTKQEHLTQLVMGNQTALATLTVTVNSVKQALDQMNSGLMRLILILVVGLLILAGVTKIDDLAKIATGGM